MLILHVSDIHFRYPFCDGNNDPDLYVRSELIAHARAQIRDLGDVDVILVTGDIAYCGNRREYDAATKWLEDMATSVGCNKQRIYVIPGNHDVDWNVFRVNLAARDAVHRIEQSGDNGSRNRLLLELLSNVAAAQHLFSSIEEYNLFAAKYDCQLYPGRLSWNTMLRIDSRTVVHLYGLNSTIISGIDGKDRMGNLFMSNLQTGFPRSPGSANLIMAHHPPEWMSDQNQLEARLFGTPNIVLFGHRHIQALRRDYNGSIVFSAGSVNPDREETGWEPAYNLIELTSAVSNEQRQVAILARQFRWQSHPNGFVPKIDMVTGDPVFVHQMPVDGEDILPVDVQTAKEAGGIAMADREASLNDPPALVGPDVRDIIYRFWELEPRDRRQVLNELGFEQVPNAVVHETMAYRAALVSIASANRLSELETAIAAKEA